MLYLIAYGDTMFFVKTATCVAHC